MIYQSNLYGAALPQAVRDFFIELEEWYGDEPMHGPYNMATGLFVMTEVLKKAGIVDDVDQIIATLETETLDSPIGPVKFGLEELDGIGHQCLMPCQVGEIRDGEYHLVYELTTDEGEDLAMEIWGK